MDDQISYPKYSYATKKKKRICNNIHKKNETEKEIHITY